MTAPSRRQLMRALQNDDELSEAVKDCEKSIRADNPEMDKSTAIAICQDMANRGVLKEFNAATPAGERDDGAELAALAEFRNPGDIRRIDVDNGVRYENVMLLAPGAWTDAGSRQTAIYSAEGIRRSAERENFVGERGGETEALEINLLHGPALHDAQTLGDVGTIPTDSIVVDDNDRLFGDLELHGDNAASELAIELLDEVLEAADDPDQQAPPVGPSVEIVDERSEPDPDTGAPRLTEMWFSGVGLVFGPASRPVELGEQAQERAIAMSEYEAPPGLVLRADRAAAIGDTLSTNLKRLIDEATDPDDGRERADVVDDIAAESGGMDRSTINAIIDGEIECPPPQRFDAFADVLDITADELQAIAEEDGCEYEQAASDGTTATGGTSLTGIRHDGSMSDDTAAELQRLLGEMQRLLQTDDELETVQTLIEQYRQAGEDLQNPATDFLDWVEANADVDPDMLEDVMDAYLQAVDADSLEATPVEGLQGWVEEQMGGGEDGEELGQHEDDDEEEMMTRDELQEAVATIQTFSSELESVKDMLADYQDEVAELEDALEEADRRLANLEDQPVRQAAEHGNSVDFLDDDDGGASDEGDATGHEDVFLD